MNPYVLTTARAGAPAELAIRLAAWHDAMVAHERRLRSERPADVCDDECPHVEADSVWSEALLALGDHAHGLSFLRSRATNAASPAGNGVAITTRESPRVGSSVAAITAHETGAEL